MPWKKGDRAVNPSGRIGKITQILTHDSGKVDAYLLPDGGNIGQWFTSDQLTAPETATGSDVFTPDEVANLTEYQLNGHMHPFTCGNRGDGKHRAIGSDLGMLIPTTRGWICPFCDYTKNWAHDFMKQPQPKESPLEQALAFGKKA